MAPGVPCGISTEINFFLKSGNSKIEEENFARDCNGLHMPNNGFRGWKVILEELGVSAVELAVGPGPARRARRGHPSFPGAGALSRRSLLSANS